MLWWANFVSSWNGVSIFHPHNSRKSQFEVWTDASTSVGCGAVRPTAGRWFQLLWPELCQGKWVKLKEAGMVVQELLTIVLASAIWGLVWRNSSVVVHCDNSAVVSVVNSGYSRIPQIMHLLRCLFFNRAHFQLSLHAVHTPGRLNSVADAVSHNNLLYLFTQVLMVTQAQDTIPQSLIKHRQPGQGCSAVVFIRLSTVNPPLLPIRFQSLQTVLRRL